MTASSKTVFTVNRETLNRATLFARLQPCDTYLVVDRVARVTWIATSALVSPSQTDDVPTFSSHRPCYISTNSCVHWRVQIVSPWRCFTASVRVPRDNPRIGARRTFSRPHSLRSGSCWSGGARSTHAIQRIEMPSNSSMIAPPTTRTDPIKPVNKGFDTTDRATLGASLIPAALRFAGLLFFKA